MPPPDRKAYRERTREHIKAYNREYRRRPYVLKYNRAWKACRKKRVRIATPKWLTKEQKKQMLQWYLNRPEGYHVDHIIPINNPIVCGLNVPWNFQYLTKKENEAKGNTFIA